MSGFALSLAALADLEQIADRIEADRPDSLESVLDDLERACGILGTYQQLGSPRPEFALPVALGTDGQTRAAI